MSLNRIFVFSLFLNYFHGVGQNLVPNPSFEEYENCPSELSQVERALGWHSARETPDYFNSCSPGDEINSQSIDAPYNHAGFQEPSTGEAYCGLFTYVAVDDYREYIQCELITPLEAGQTYYFSMKVSRGEGFGIPFDHYNMESNNLGVYFTTTSNQSSENPLGIYDFAHINFIEVISDTNNWLSLTGQFVPNDNFTHMAIGNFYSFSQTTLVNIDGTPDYAAYYLIDDVCLSSTPNCSLNDIRSVNSNASIHLVQVGPNQITLESTESGMVTIMLLNGTIFLQEKVEPGKNELSLNNILSGLFLLQFTNNNFTLTKKIFKP